MMPTASQTAKDIYNETEAADALGISRGRLLMLLDQHVFNDGTRRPDNITLQASDLLLVRYWHMSTPPTKVVSMPKR